MPAQAGTQTFFGNVDASGDDWDGHTFHAVPGDQIAVSLSWATGSADLNLFLKNPAGATVASSNGSAKPETISWTAGTTGNWTIGVKARSGSSNYTVTLDLNGASATGGGTVEYGAVSQSSPWMGHKVDFVAGDQVNLDLSWSNSADLNMFLKNPQGTVVASASGSDNPEVIDHAVAQTGEYTVSIKAKTGGSYFALAITVNGGSGGGGVSVNGDGATPGDAWNPHSVALATGSHTATLTFDNATADVDLFVYDPSGTFVTKTVNTNSPVTASFDVNTAGDWKVVAKFIAGSSTYTIDIAAGSGGGGGSSGGGGSGGGGGSSTAVDLVRPWAAANEGFATATLAEAVEDAQHYDFLVAHPGTYAPYVAEMRAANPDLTLLAYVNAMLVPPTEKANYPNWWFSRDANNDYVRSQNFGNYLMRPNVTAWRNDRAQACSDAIAASGYDGCMLDMLTIAPLYPSYVTGLPVNPATNQVWEHADWQAATAGLAGVVGAANPGKIIAGNGFGSGPRYYKSTAPTSVLNGVLDYAITESWMRTAKDGLSSYRTEAQWKESVDMLADAASQGTRVMAMVKVWTTGASQSYKDTWHRYALGTFLLGTDGSHSFVFSYDEHADPTADHPYYDVDLGNPTGSYVKQGSLYKRTFQNGFVAVNPTGSGASISLPAGSFTKLEGGTASGSVWVAPHSAQILVST